MIVMKFGGASLKDADSVRKVTEIINDHIDSPLVVVVSAMAKTTNALEKLSEAACKVKAETADELYSSICHFHIEMCRELFSDSGHVVFGDIQVYLHEIRKIIDGILLLEDFPDRIYDRIVSYGELISSVIVYRYLEEVGYAVQWSDARKLIKTDSDYKAAEVNYTHTRQAILDATLHLTTGGQIMLTQGFIGSNAEGRTTTLGREGSDYTAAIIAGILQAKRLIIWKDVPGLMNADPRKDANAVILPEVSYEQAVSMSFFGASVIHPKTIEPIRNAGIPLYIKSFISPELPGTCIHTTDDALSAVVRNERTQQCRIVISSRDFRFMDGDQAAILLSRTRKFGVGITYCIIAARELTLITDMQSSGLMKFLEDIESDYQYVIEMNLRLISIEFPDTKTPELPIGEGEILRIEGNRLHFLKQM
jgi:aspartate kinase